MKSESEFAIWNLQFEICDNLRSEICPECFRPRSQIQIGDFKLQIPDADYSDQLAGDQRDILRLRGSNG